MQMALKFGDCDGHSDPLKKTEWMVMETPLKTAQEMVAKYHYAGGGSNTGTYVHGLFSKEDFGLFGVAWWIPPTKSAANASFPGRWREVLALSRVAISPRAPKNSASYLVGASMRLIDRDRWPCLITYADKWQGHTGAIYRATNWEYLGLTAPEPTWILNGRMVSRKAGPVTRTKAEMELIGARMIGRFAKHKFRHIQAT
jgi:hypothetical protein